MSSAPQFPNDENGDVLQRMWDGGDDLSEPRIVDFCFIFPEEQQAAAFAGIISDPAIKVSVSYYEEKAMWQAIAQRRMIPTHQDITAQELALTNYAESVGGSADGWGCMQVDRK
jgi:hypothetical protein